MDRYEVMAGKMAPLTDGAHRKWGFAGKVETRSYERLVDALIDFVETGDGLKARFLTGFAACLAADRKSVENRGFGVAVRKVRCHRGEDGTVRVSSVETMHERRYTVDDKTNLRELCRIAAGEAENIYDYRELLESWGVDTEFKRGRMYVTDTDNNRYAFSVAKLDADLGTKGLEAAFTANVAKSIHAEGSAAVAEKRNIEQQKAMATETKERYLAQIRSVYQKYRKEIRGMEGMEIADIPKLKLPRPDSDIADDSEVKRLILACWRGADELRAEVSSTVMPKGKKNGGNAGSGGSQRAQQAPTQERPEPNKENGER